MARKPEKKKSRALILEANEIIERIFAESNKKYGIIEYDSAVMIRSWRDSNSS